MDKMLMASFLILKSPAIRLQDLEQIPDFHNVFLRAFDIS
jgi:hypothetical protein